MLDAPYNFAITNVMKRVILIFLIIIAGMASCSFAWVTGRGSAQSRAEVERRLPNWVSVNEFIWHSHRTKDDPLGQCTFSIIDVEIDWLGSQRAAARSRETFKEWRENIEDGEFRRHNDTNHHTLRQVFHGLPSMYYVWENMSLADALGEVNELLSWYYTEQIPFTLQQTDNCEWPVSRRENPYYFVKLYDQTADYILIDMSRELFILAIIDDGKFYYLGP